MRTSGAVGDADVSSSARTWRGSARRSRSRRLGLVRQHLVGGGDPANDLEYTAITQLFRLNAASTPATPAMVSARALSESPDLAEIQALLLMYAQRIDALSNGSSSSDKYRHLGKPVVHLLLLDLR